MLSRLDFIAGRRWELWLLLIAPLAGELTLGVLSRVFEDDVIGLLLWSPTSGLELGDLTGFLVIRLPIVLELNAALLPIVIAQRRPMLSYAWGYAVTAGMVEVVSYMVIDLVSVSPSSQVAIVFIPASFVMLWFARKAASISFPHSLSMIAIAAALTVPGNVIPSQIILRFVAPTPVELSAIMIIGTLSAQALGVWVLVKAQGDNLDSLKQVIRAVVVMSLSISLWAVVEWWEHGEFLVDARWLKTQVVPSPLALIVVYGVVMLISYILRRASSLKLFNRRDCP